MQLADTLRETQIPLPHDPATAGRKATPDSAARLCTALRNLLWLLTYVTVMRLLGYRIPRPSPGPRASKPTHPIAPVIASVIAPVIAEEPATPPVPRVKHRYLDRDMCLHMLAGISSAFAPAPPIASEPPAPAAAPRPLCPPPRQSHSARVNRHAASATPCAVTISAISRTPFRKNVDDPCK